METKTKQQIDQEVETYLNKTALHLFVTNNYFYKVIPINNDGKLYAATIIIGKNQVSITTREAVSDYMYKHCGNGSTNALKKVLFPEYQETKSIPNFKAMRTLIDEITGGIKLDNKTNADLIDKIKTRVVELDMIKE